MSQAPNGLIQVVVLGFNVPQSNKDSLKLKELMVLCITLQSRVLALKQTKITQANKIDSLKRRVKNLEKKQRSRTYKLKRLYKKKRKFFAAKRAEEKKNISPTKAQQKSIMCTYSKNMEGWKPKSLKNKSFDNIQELFDKAMKRVNTFIDDKSESVVKSSKKGETEVTECSSKRAREEIEQENAKK
nr:hypothetical protein [Tanacetum cinerariifolium]